MKICNWTDNPIVIRLESESGNQSQEIKVDAKEYKEIPFKIPITSIDTISIESM